MRKIFNSRNLSLACGVANATFAVQSALAGNYLICGVCTFFAVFCFNNYRNAKSVTE